MPIINTVHAPFGFFDIDGPLAITGWIDHLDTVLGRCRILFIGLVFTHSPPTTPSSDAGLSLEKHTQIIDEGQSMNPLLFAVNGSLSSQLYKYIGRVIYW